jgi:hypothetical protein
MNKGNLRQKIYFCVRTHFFINNLNFNNYYGNKKFKHLARR